jgi:hypothetical protein
MGPSSNEEELRDFIKKHKYFDYNQLFENSKWENIGNLNFNNILMLIEKTNIDVNKSFKCKYFGTRTITLYFYAYQIHSIEMLAAIVQQGKCYNRRLIKEIINLKFERIWSSKCPIKTLEKFIITHPKYNYNRYFENGNKITKDFCQSNFDNLIMLIEKTNIDVNKSFRLNKIPGEEKVTIYKYARKYVILSILAAISRQKKYH